MDGFIILSQHCFKFIDVSIILFLLKGNIHNCFTNVVIHFFKLFGLLNENSEFIFEVYFISILSCFH